MTQFDDRRDAFEKKYAHDEELQFRAAARRNKALGLWAAERIGRADAEAYAKEVVVSDFAEAGDADVLRKVKADFDAAGVAVSPEELRAKMDELMLLAADEIKAGR